MLQDRTWGVEVFLWQVASNILQVDLIIIPCFRESSVHQGLGFTLIKSFERPKHLPLYLFSFWNLTLTRHITSVYYQTIPKRMWFWLTGWRKNRHTIDSLRSSVLQESYHDSSLELSDGRWDYTSAIILEEVPASLRLIFRRQCLTFPPRMPEPVQCPSSRCLHRKLFDKHFDRDEWEE